MSDNLPALLYGSLHAAAVVLFVVALRRLRRRDDA
jgi:hypothetical protein